MYNNGQQFGLSYEANQESNLTNEGEVHIDLNDIVSVLNLFQGEDVTANNECGLVDGSGPDNTKATSTAAGDPFDSCFADEVAEKDQYVSRRRRKGPTIKAHKHRRMSKRKNGLTCLK